MDKNTLKSLKRKYFLAPLMLWYNGQRGGGHKLLFYAFYPAHIYILYALSWGLYLLLN